MSEDRVKSVESEDKLKRGLTNRHIQLIAIGGAIGTGLFMGSGKTIHAAGPSIVFVYAIIGFFLYFVMRAMGELLLSNLKYKSFIDFGEDILGPWAGFFMGWTYWFCWVVIGVADIIAVSGYFAYWFPHVHTALPALGFVALLIALNLFSVNMFGEMEFWFASLKVVAIIAIIVVSVVLVAKGFKSPTGNIASLSNLVDYGGIFPKGIMGFFAGFQIAFFAFVGIELVGTTAAETKDPEKTLPRAINVIPVRIVIFYVLSLIGIMAITPWSELNEKVSPFVTTFSYAGLAAAAGVMNFVALTSAASSANSGIYSTSRMLFGLSQIGVAPKLLGRLSSQKVPRNGLFFSCLCLVLGSGILILIPEVMESFTIMTTIASICFAFVWSVILLAYLKYRKDYPERHAKSKYKVPGGVFMCYATLAFMVFVIALLALEPDTRLVLCLTPIWFVALAIGYHLFGKKSHTGIEWDKQHPKD